jgi:hypothetical protein
MAGSPVMRRPLDVKHGKIGKGPRDTTISSKKKGHHYTSDQSHRVPPSTVYGFPLLSVASTQRQKSHKPTVGFHQRPSSTICV